MFRGGQRLLGVASVAALGASCLAVAACSGTTDPLASLTGNQVLTEAVANFNAARSLTIDGLVNQSGTNLVLRLGIIPGQGCAGTVENLSKGSYDFVKTASTVYLKPDSMWWTNVAGAEGTGVSQLVNGKYLEAPISGSSELDTTCDAARMAGTDNATGTVVKGGVTSLNGSQVLALNESGTGNVVDVTDTSKPEIARVFEPERDRNGSSGQFTVNVGARVTLSAPPSGQDVDAADFGISSDTDAPDPVVDFGGTMITQAFANMKAASTLTMSGSGADTGQVYSVDLGFKANQGCAGTVGYGSKGSVKIIVIGSTVYFKPDDTFWQTNAGAQASAVINLVNGRYIGGSSSNSDLKNIAAICGIYQSIGPSNPIAGIATAAKVAPAGGITVGQVTTIDGIKVLPINDAGGGVIYVTDTGKLEVVEISQAKAGSGGTYGTFKFKIGVPVTLTAPPAGEVLDGAAVGL